MYLLVIRTALKILAADSSSTKGLSNGSMLLIAKPSTTDTRIAM